VLRYFFHKIIQVIVDPDYATSTLYDTPRFTDAFAVVSAYALATSIDSFLSGYLRTQTVSIGLLSFLVSTLTTYLLWFILAILLHASADLLGGLGEFPSALGFVGLGTAPLIFTSIISIVLTVISVVFFPDEPDRIFPLMASTLTVIGMAWGSPGVICYFGMKHAEKLHPLKAFVITFVFFAALASFVMYKSDFF
jgi:hypothetical protein